MMLKKKSTQETYLEEINMIDFFKIFNIDNPDKTKVKFNMNPADRSLRALDLLLSDDERWIEMNAHYDKKNVSNNYKDAEYVLSFAQYYPYGPEFFMFGGLYKIEPKRVDDSGPYKLQLMTEFSEYSKRLIIRLKKPIGRDVYNRKFNNLKETLSPEVYEIKLPNSLDTFTGYQDVCLTYKQLQAIFENQSIEWKNALSNIKAIYCITDISTGKLYIGSASGDNEGLWERWSTYANEKTNTGGNKYFKELKAKDPTYIQRNFTYSILEIFDPRTKREDIINREEHWKEVFKTYKFGMN